MSQKIRVAAVSYLNTKPLLYGLEHHPVREEIEITEDYPARLPLLLQHGDADLALMPVAAISDIPGARIAGDYGIAADGPVASVCLFSAVPMEDIEEVMLDFQSRTSVKLVQVLLKHYWKKDVRFLPAPEDYISQIRGKRAGVIIGDRALENLHSFTWIYDLAEAWKNWTGLPFVFAAWIAVRELPEDFMNRFNAANRLGVDHAAELGRSMHYPHFNLEDYYTKNIHYHLDEQKRKGLDRFLHYLREL